MERPAAGNVFASESGNAYALPAAFAAGALLNFFGIGIITFIWYHEFGHAAAGLLSGRWAFAIPIAGLTFVGQEKSFIVILGLGAGLLWLLKRAIALRDPGQAVLWGGLVGLQAYLTLFAPAAETDMWISYAGSAGELVLTTAVIAAFYYRLSDRLRWDFWRYPLLLTATSAFLYAAAFWNRVRADPENLMMGESIAKSRENDADWVRLVRENGWTPAGLASSYHGLALAGELLIVLHYLWFMNARHRDRR